MTEADETIEVSFMLNGEDVTIEISPDQMLIDVLRSELALTGTTEGCGVGVCGSCTILLDDDPISSCLQLGVNVEGKEVWTVEGLEDLAPGEGHHPIQEAFQDHEGFQCGYCTPGILMSGAALLERNPDPSRADIETYLSENICRCTGYDGIVRSIQEASDDGIED